LSSKFTIIATGYIFRMRPKTIDIFQRLVDLMSDRQRKFRVFMATIMEIFVFGYVASCVLQKITNEQFLPNFANNPPDYKWSHARRKEPSTIYNFIFLCLIYLFCFQHKVTRFGNNLSIGGRIKMCYLNDWGIWRSYWAFTARVNIIWTVSVERRKSFLGQKCGSLDKRLQKYSPGKWWSREQAPL
jgi:hypothetical protein